MEHEVFSPRPDQRRQLRGSRGRLVLEGRQLRARPGQRGAVTPIYADGIVYTVAGRRRTVVAIDPATGETLWTFREPNTARWEGSPRQNYGRGVAYYEIDGRGVIYVVTPAFFLHALDAKTGYPLAAADGILPSLVALRLPLP